MNPTTGYGLGGPEIESRWGARFSAPVQTGPGAHPASCKMGTGSLPGGKERQGRDADPSPLLVPWSRKSRAIPLLPLWAIRPVQSLSACTKVHYKSDSSLPGSCGPHSSLPEHSESFICQGSINPTVIYQGPMSPAVICQGPMKPTVIYQGPISPTVICQGPTSPTVICQGPMKPKVFCQSHTNPTVLCQELINPTFLYPGSNNPVVLCQ
jgi:hypothetical protein